ncbi:mitochondrial sodium/calcium exchanger protein-like [Anopheles ziemanni]|uniref:mitochondrial sodium/calcium exchanger protein-like n=1 Tax=Anopheles coustani TaxID=139045 RepID=UPI0026588280|nr:mitochondrial sodium/calcium exchanger protein-like [Anopheles coustani]XP_058178327.1 mitochondrial sodium/calcium exchanger protein-like [Anopheles ziemanni]
MSSGKLLDFFTNDTPTYEAHQNIIVSLKTQPCSNVHSVHADERCLFVQETEHCRESAHYIDYMHFMYCIVDSSNVILFGLAVTGLCLIALTLACIIHNICVRRYVDAVLYVAKSLHLNEYIAGVTLLTYGNGLPQVLSMLKQHTTGDTELIFNQYLGTAVYQTSFLAALVISMRRFYIYPEVIVPNIITLLVTAILVEAFMYKEQVGILKTVILFVLYVTFLSALYTISLVLDRQGNRSRSQITVRDASGNALDISRTETDGNEGEQNSIWQILRTLRRGGFRNASLFGKIISLGNLLIEAITAMLLPQVNYGLPLHGWSKHLFTVNLNLFPLFFIYTAFVDVLDTLELGYVCLGSLATTVVLTTIIYCTTRTDRKPFFFNALALFTVFATSYLVMLLMYEMVAILETLSIIAKISSASFVITVLSWGNCWIDLVTSITLAKRGYPRLAFAACLGGPVFNILIGLCTVFCVQMIRTGSTTIHVRDGTSGPTCAAYLLVITLTLLLSVLFSRFQARTSLAFCLFTLYFTFLVYIVLCEFEITHGYGTDHNDDGEYFLDKIPNQR